MLLYVTVDFKYYIFHIKLRVNSKQSAIFNVRPLKNSLDLVLVYVLSLFHIYSEIFELIIFI